MGVARVEEGAVVETGFKGLRSVVGKKGGCKGLRKQQWWMERGLKGLRKEGGGQEKG